MAVLVSSHRSSTTVIVTVFGNRKAWWDYILWPQGWMMTWSRFPKVNVLDTEGEKAIFRNWFGGSLTLGAHQWD